MDLKALINWIILVGVDLGYILNSMRVLGIDPGIARVGWGVVDGQSGKFTAIAYDCFTTSLKSTLAVRLDQIHQYIVELIKEYQPDAISVESLFFAANSKTALTVGHARGVILLAASNMGLPVISFTPLQVKQSLTGFGRADKRQIQMMIKSILKVSVVQDDTADALAIALAYHFSQKMKSLTDRV